MRRSRDRTRNPLGEYVLHKGAGFIAKERPHVLEALATLEPHLGRWDPPDISLEVSLQDRGRKEQRSRCGRPCRVSRRSWPSPTTATSLAPFTKPSMS
jgi:hypothetical protein